MNLKEFCWLKRIINMQNENKIKKPLLIGITGGSGCGKSTLCELLIKDSPGCKVEMLHTDDYYKPVKPKIIAPVTRKEYDDYNHPDAIDFNKLFADLDKLLMQSDECDVILIEGLFVLYLDELRERFDLKIFIDVQSDERLVRRIKRNMEWGYSLDEIADYYLETVRYRHDEFVAPSRWYADIVLNGSSFSKVGVQMIQDWIVKYSK